MIIRASELSNGLLLCFLVCAPASALAQERMTPDVESVRVGYGWSDKTQSPTSYQCVIGSSSAVQWSQRYSQARAVQSSESLYKDQDLSITAKVKARFPGGRGGVSGRYRRFDSTLNSSNRANLALQLILERDGQRWDAPPDADGFRLKQQFRNLLVDAAGKQRFYERCGDYFIEMVSNRSVVTAIASTTFDLNETRQVVEKSINANGSYGVMSVNAAVHSLANATSQHRDASTVVTVESSGFELLDGSNAALNFPGTLLAVETYFQSITKDLLKPIAWKIKITPYSSLDDCIQSGGCITNSMESTFDPDALYYERLLAIQSELSAARSEQTGNNNDKDRQYLSTLHRSMTASNGAARRNQFEGELRAVDAALRPRLDASVPCTPGDDCSKPLDVDRNDLRWATLVPVARSQFDEDVLGPLLADPVEQTRLEYALHLYNSRIAVAHANRCRAVQEYCQPLDDVQELCETFDLVGLPTSACARVSHPLPEPAMLQKSGARFIPIPAWQSAVIYDVRGVPGGWRGQVEVTVVDAAGNPTQAPVVLQGQDFPRDSEDNPTAASKVLRVHPSSEPRFLRMTGGAYVNNVATNFHPYGENELRLASLNNVPLRQKVWELNCGIWANNPNLLVRVEIEPGPNLPVLSGLATD